MTKVSIWTTAFLLFAVSSACAWAEQQTAEPQTSVTMIDTTFMKIDADKDGFISRDEAKLRPYLIDQFDKADTNADGKIDLTEFRQVKS